MVLSRPIRIELPALPPPLRRCRGACKAQLYCPSVPAFTGTVFAVDGHDCVRAGQILAEARRGAVAFEMHPHFVHGRIITDRITVHAWLHILQGCTRHPLHSRVLPLRPGLVEGGGAAQLTFSYRAGFEPDWNDVVEGIEKQLQGRA